MPEGRIILCAHIDRVYTDFELAFDGAKLSGLLDNFAGVLLTYGVLFDDRNLQSLARSGRLVVYHNQGEEWGKLVAPPKVTKKDTVVCVDVWCGGVSKIPNRYDFTVDNIYGVREKAIKDLQVCMDWEGHKCLLRKYTGNPDDDDESWLWHGKVGRCMTFDIQVKAPGDGWHRQDASVSFDRLLKCRQGLKRLLAYLI